MFLTAKDGSRVALHDLGGAGPTILICHATGFCGRAYEPLARALSGQFRVWAIHMPGHGDSDLPAGGDFAWQAMVPQVVAATRAISATPLACVVGHSMGGAVALQAAAQEPSLFAAAYLYEPVIIPPADAARRTSNNPMADGARRRQDTFPSKQAALWRYATRPPLNDLDAASLAAYVDHGFKELADGSARLKCSPDSEASTFEASAGITTESVAKAALPTLLVSGAQSPLATLVPPVLAALSNAETSVHPHLGHFGPLQSPVAIAEEIANHARRQGD